MSSEKDESPQKEKAINTTTKSFGIRKVELLSLQYDTPILRGIFFFSAFLVAYCFSFDVVVRRNLQYYATSSYSQHSLFTTVNLIQAVVSAVAQTTYARLSDRFGRLELTIVSIIFYVIGTVLQSYAEEIKVYAAGATLYQIGFSGFRGMLLIMISDFSNLNWRLAASFIPILPYIVNTWVSGDMVKLVLTRYSWQWGIRMWSFIFPISCIPLITCLFHMLIKARMTPEWQQLKQEANNRIPSPRIIFKNWKTLLTLKFWKTLVVELWKYWKTLATELFWDLDVFGIIGIVVILGLILVPLTLAGGTTSKWGRPSTIVPLVIGFISIPLFIIWEAKYSRTPIMPLPLMKDRGVWSALMIGIMINWVWYMPNDFMYTVLVVGMNASEKAATRITSLYTFVTVIAGPIVGLFVVWIRKLKLFIIFGVFCWCISLGLFIHFRGANDGIKSQTYINGVIGGLVLMGYGNGLFGNASQVSIVTVTNHEYMSVMLGLYLICYWVGAAIGVAVSGAIWTNKMYGVILNNMNDMGINNATGLATAVYQDPFEFAKAHAWATPPRIAVVISYAHVQRYLCIVGLVLCFPMLVFTFFLRDHRLESVQSLEIGQNEKQFVVNNNDHDLIVDKIKGLFQLLKN